MHIERNLENMSSNNENSTGDNNFGDDSPSPPPPPTPPPVIEQTVKWLTLDKGDIDSLSRITNKVCDYVIEMFISSNVEDYIKACAPIIVDCYRTELQQVLSNGLTVADIRNFIYNVETRMNEQNVDDILSAAFYGTFLYMVFPKFRSQVIAFIRSFLEDLVKILKYIEENVDRSIHTFGKIRRYIEQLELNENNITNVFDKINRILDINDDSCDYLSMIENILLTDT